MSTPPNIGNPPDQTLIYHITDLGNLEGILAEGKLLSDAVMAERETEEIGHGHIKQRRLTEIRVACCQDRFVGEFVPFYFCPRSPMLYTVNIGSTGRSPGCQTSIIHLVSRVEQGIGSGSQWAISDCNAGTYYASFENDLAALDGLEWPAIRAKYWSDKSSQKAAEFLVADSFPWNGVHHIGCQNSDVAAQVQSLIQNENHQPAVTVERSWYY